MDNLQQVLERMQKTLSETVWVENTSPTLQPGLMAEGGNPVTTTVSPTTMKSPVPQSGEPQNKKSGSAASVERTPEEQSLLLSAISKLCALQKQYGKTAAELETLLDGYLWLLDDIPTQEILFAMKEYANRNDDIPTPADIRNLIDPPPPKTEPLSGALYVAYQKRVREGDYLLRDEREFCRAYEAQEHAKVRGGSEEFRGCLKQLEEVNHE